MKISAIYNLQRSQAELDFIDINPDFDTHLFIDPYFLSIRSDRFSFEATRTIQSFFQRFIDLMRDGNEAEARRLFDHLHEPNETCLGLSQGIPAGNGVGDTDADSIFESIRESRALQTGQLAHLEDFRIFVKNIGKDKLSDMTTNIIRKHLIDYTQSQANFLEIPLTPNTSSGDCWNRTTNRWEQFHTEMLVINNKKILLVPKSIVSYSNQYTEQKYRQHNVLNFLKNEHLQLQTALVQRKRNRHGDVIKEWVTKESVKNHEGSMDKDYLADFTANHRHVFDNFRNDQANNIKSLDNTELDPRIDLQTITNHLRNTLNSILPGTDTATNYHRTVAAILELVFYPALTCPHIETRINDGRKRIDITFDNAASDGFFDSISRHHHTPCPYILIECKNYSRDIQNPEVDQMIGRFHPNRGQFGMIICRTIQNMPTLVSRCRDAWNAQQGIILPLVDHDLINMLDELDNGSHAPYQGVLSTKLREIVMG